jgi:hypothetical protein
MTFLVSGVGDTCRNLTAEWCRGFSDGYRGGYYSVHRVPTPIKQQPTSSPISTARAESRHCYKPGTSILLYCCEPRRKQEMSHVRAVIARSIVRDGKKQPVLLTDVKLTHVIILTKPKMRLDVLMIRTLKLHWSY